MLLRHPFFNWVSRSERYNLLDIVFDVDFLDERKFADAAAARAQAGADTVDLTYRASYVEDPAGQWQGYTDTDADRAWGVQGWARRAGQAAVFDWAVANALLPAEDPDRTGIQKIDRTTVGAIKKISANMAEIQATYDDANNGFNPLGIDSETVPFDVSPAALDAGRFTKTHFEQIADRADQALANAFRVFDHASSHRDRVRKQQNTSDKFAIETREQDRDFRSRLKEIFGTPYSGLIGTGKPYPAGYNGPDLMFFMYVDVSEFEAGVPRALVPGGAETGIFEANFNAFTTAYTNIQSEKITPLLGGSFSGNGSSGGGSTFSSLLGSLGDIERDPSGRLNIFTEDVQFPYFVTDITDDVDSITGFGSPRGDANVQLNMPFTADDYTFQAPPEWGFRESTGELQSIVSQMLRAESDLARSLSDYDNYVKELKDMTNLLKAKFNLDANKILVKQANLGATISLGALIQAAEISKRAINNADGLANDYAKGLAEAQPKVTGLSNDFTSAGRAAIIIAKAGITSGAKAAIETIDQLTSILNFSKQVADLSIDLELANEDLRFDVRQSLKAIEQHLRNDGYNRADIFNKLENLRQISDRYRTVLNKGFGLVGKRQDFNKKTAALVQRVRYQDMAFRNFRSDALQKYRASFDLAARYAYLAAKAYDYDTNLDPSDPSSAAPLLNEIVRVRSLGTPNGSPVHSSRGLADILATMRDNFDVLKAQMGLNNRQKETGKFSLRYEHFRIGNQDNNDADAWIQELQDHRVTDLWSVPEFRRYCRPFAPESAGTQPGLVIPFSTEIVAGRNVFGWPLGGDDHAYDPSNFATKIQAVGVWLENYDHSQLSITPRVYLVPTGVDVMSVPASPTLETRQWNVVDQSIPVPFPVSVNDINQPDWIPINDSLSGSIAEIRRYSSFRAYGDNSPDVDDSQLVYDTRLVGRSVWNSRWVLIIPGRTFSADADSGLTQFINDITDIKLNFQTFGYSGN